MNNLPLKEKLSNQPANACRYQGVQIGSILNFQNQLNSVLSKLAHAICFYIL